jgi:hypothetical protein
MPYAFTQDDCQTIAAADFLTQGLDADIHVSALQARIFLENFFTQTEE